MKKLKRTLIIALIFCLVLVGILVSNVSTKAYSVSNFGVDSTSTFDDFYTDLNGFYLNTKLKGHYYINNQKEFFVCLASSSNNNVILITSYVFTSSETFVFEDDVQAPIYDTELVTLISNINNYLLNNTAYNTILSNANYYILDNYSGSVGVYNYSNSISGVVAPSYDTYFSSFVANFGYLNSTYLYKDLINFIYYDFGLQIEDIIEDYDIVVEQARDDGYSDGYSDGLEGTSEESYEEGRKAGYTQAVEEGEQITGYIFGLWDTFMNGIRDMFNVNIFGINLSSIIFFIISLAIIGFVLRRLF